MTITALVFLGFVIYLIIVAVRFMDPKAKHHRHLMLDEATVRYSKIIEEAAVEAAKIKGWKCIRICI
ncbi:MAG: hypothetical protein FWD57_12715 [Polyangiaceae bacterium]|nr:hypothetical protein [Polyangiaceae bacterium]